MQSASARYHKMAIAYLLLIIGLHRFYLGRPFTGAIQISLGIVPVAFVGIGDGSLADPVGIIAISGIATWCLIDAFLIPRWVRNLP